MFISKIDGKKAGEGRTANPANAMTARGIATPKPTFAPVLRPVSTIGTPDDEGVGLPEPVAEAKTPVRVAEEEVELVNDTVLELELLVVVVVTSFGSVKLKYREEAVGDVAPSMKI